MHRGNSEDSHTHSKIMINIVRIQLNRLQREVAHDESS